MSLARRCAAYATQPRVAARSSHIMQHQPRARREAYATPPRRRVLPGAAMIRRRQRQAACSLKGRRRI
jgi:hypothetical protein